MGPSTVDRSRRTRPIRPDCPHVDRHRLGPEDRAEWRRWAADMTARGFRQERCPGCGLYVIWKRF